MNALEEISGMVKKAYGMYNAPITNPRLKAMAAKPIDWFNQYGTSYDQQFKNVGSATPKKVSPAKPSAKSDPKIMPNGLRIRGSGWTGRQVVQGGSAPVSRVQRSELKPFNALHSFKNPSQLAQLPSMKMQGKMNAEGAAYEEILKRLNAKGGDPSINMQNARRLAPMVAKNYRRQADGSWKAVSQSGAAQATQMDRKMPSGVYPKV